MNTKIGFSMASLIAVNLQNLIDQRDKHISNQEETHITRGFNLSIQQGLNSMIEGYLRESITKKLEDDRISLSQMLPEKENSTGLLELFSRLINDKLTDIERDSWSSIKSKYEIVFGNPINLVVGDSVHKSISCQFKIRNILAHGKKVTMNHFFDDTSSEVQVKYDKNLTSVFNYLVDEKLVKSVNKKNVKVNSFLDSNVTNHFIDKSVEFVILTNEAFLSKVNYAYDFGIMRYLKNVNTNYNR